MEETNVEKKWYVYILSCADGTLYTGVTTDIHRRIKEHNGQLGKNKGSKYTKARRPVTLTYHESATNRSAAQIREAAIRRLTLAQKNLLSLQKE